MIPTIYNKFSWFDAPITNTCRTKEYSLFEAWQYITTDPELQKLTELVRGAPHIKSKILPYITASGLFKERRLSEIISYSSIVSIDLDDLEFDDEETRIKSKIFADNFLNPGLIFVSPSGFGLKIFIRVANGDPQQHNDYFNVISMYLYVAYGVTADPACRDISRACFLCHDPEAMYSASGCVSAPELFTIFPPAAAPAAATAAADLADLAPKTSCFDPEAAMIKACKPLKDIDYRPLVGDKLNRYAGVQNQAENALRNIGWHEKGNYWYRSGKNNREGHSGSFRYPRGSEIRFFRNFSSSALWFDTSKSYTDCMIIAILEYNGDYKRCINDLAFKYRL